MKLNRWPLGLRAVAQPPRVNPPSRNCESSLRWHKRISHLFCDILQFTKPAVLMTSFKFCKDSFVVGLAGGHDVKEDTRQFMAGILDGFDGTKASALRAIVVAEERFVIVKRLTCHPKNLGDSVLGFEPGPGNPSSGAGSPSLGHKFSQEEKLAGVGKSDRSAPNSLKMV